MGGIEVLNVDTNGHPVSGVVCRLSLITKQGTVIADTQTSGPTGDVTLDPHTGFCATLPYTFLVTVTYQGRVNQQSESPNVLCFAPKMTFLWPPIHDTCNPPCDTKQCMVCNGFHCIPLCGTGFVCDGDGNCLPQHGGCNPPCATSQCLTCSGTRCVNACNSSEQCLNGRCVPITTRCTDSSQCNIGYQCDISTGQCVPAGVCPTGCTGIPPNCQCNCPTGCTGTPPNCNCAGCIMGTNCFAPNQCNSSGRCIPPTGDGCGTCVSPDLCFNGKCYKNGLYYAAAAGVLALLLLTR